MPETTQKIFWIPRGDRGASKRGAAGGPVFLKSAFFVIMVIFLQTYADINVRNLPKKFWIPRGPGGLVNEGQQGGQFS